MDNLYLLTKQFEKHAPTLLAGASIVGMVSTVILAVKATPKALEYIKNDSRANHDGDPCGYSKFEAVKSAWTTYIPATLAGIATLACIIGSNLTKRQQHAQLISAYSLLNQYCNRYKNASIAVYGEDADHKIKTQMAKEVYIYDQVVNNGGIYQPNFDNSDKVLFCDNYSMRYFNATMASVVNAQYHINRNLVLRGEVSLNELYEFLGIDELNGGYAIGWRLDDLYESGYQWLDFVNEFIRLEDGMECYMLMTSFEPSNLLDED